MKQHHLCLDCRLLEASGIGTYLKNALLSLAQEERYRLTLIGKAEELQLLKRFSPHLIPMKSKIYSLEEQFEYPKVIPHCDLFWAPHFNIPFFPIKAKRRMTTVHDAYHLAHLNRLPFGQKIYAKAAYNAAFFLSDYLLTVSEFSKREILKYAFLKPKNLFVVPNTFHFIPAENLFHKRRGILTVGNLKPHKNLLNLIKAFGQLRPQEKLYIVGKVEGLIGGDQKLFKTVENDPYLKQNVLFTGHLTDEKLKQLYASSKVFVFPSTYEGFGYPPLEAMASGCPVVASRIDAILEVCEDAVEYVEPHSIHSIAEGIKRVLNEIPRREWLITKGKALIEKKRAQNSGYLSGLKELIDACCNCT